MTRTFALVSLDSKLLESLCADVSFDLIYEHQSNHGCVEASAKFTNGHAPGRPVLCKPRSDCVGSRLDLFEFQTLMYYKPNG